mmetsp:Transcript_11389/g.34243  ORF Transcript_11389/g.34243 Transcript_11389/m.34243 type:complete len:213 (+) Transcript_11389:767-1405(+)
MSGGPRENHYEVLGVPQDATAAAIKEAYRASVLKRHPDKAPCALTGAGGRQAAVPGGAEEPPEHPAGFVALQRAWEVLRHPSRRVIHDRQLAAGQQRLTGAIAEELDLDDLHYVLVPLHDPESSSLSDSTAAHPCETSAAVGVPSAPSFDEKAAVAAPAAAEELAGKHRWVRGCRCGGRYVVEEEELSELAAAVVVPCSHCSLAVRVAYSIA